MSDFDEACERIMEAHQALRKIRRILSGRQIARDLHQPVEKPMSAEWKIARIKEIVEKMK